MSRSAVSQLLTVNKDCCFLLEDVSQLTGRGTHIHQRRSEGDSEPFICVVKVMGEGQMTGRQLSLGAPADVCSNGFQMKSSDAKRSSPSITLENN